MLRFVVAVLAPEDVRVVLVGSVSEVVGVQAQPYTVFVMTAENTTVFVLVLVTTLVDVELLLDGVALMLLIEVDVDVVREVVA